MATAAGLLSSKPGWCCRSHVHMHAAVLGHIQPFDHLIKRNERLPLLLAAGRLCLQHALEVMLGLLQLAEAVVAHHKIPCTTGLLELNAVLR
jgi:hypothetical protein